MSLLKIPFLVASAISIHTSLTSPSPPPLPQEKVVPSVSESFMRLVLYIRLPEFVKITAWAASLVEVANILAMHIGPLQIPEGIYGASAVRLLYTLHPTPITPVFLAGSLSVLIGGMLRVYCMSTLGKFWSFPLSIRKEHRIVTNGPYSIVRHPSYTGLLLQYIGVAIMHGSEGSWTRQFGTLQLPYMNVLRAIVFLLSTTTAFMIVNRCSVEDKMLQRALGEDWENWAKEVKYRLIPGVY
ncbi:ICMT-domain-containing protein [Suillus decipiens]|nr:ICMT-domain-containing protein [Suillus decipiens]